MRLVRNAAHEASDAAKALSALVGYLNRANRHSEQYKEALGLYPQYQQLAEGAAAHTRRQCGPTASPMDAGDHGGSRKR